jgi:hypothetical protein
MPKAREVRTGSKIEWSKALPVVTLAWSVACATGLAQRSRLAAGQWGGEHVVLTVAEADTTIEFDCAHGTINGPINVLEQGRFSATGTFTREGGPTRPGDPGGRSAVYEGSVRDNTMSMTVRLSDGGRRGDVHTDTRCGRAPREVSPATLIVASGDGTRLSIRVTNCVSINSHCGVRGE